MLNWRSYSVQFMAFGQGEKFQETTKAVLIFGSK